MDNPCLDLQGLGVSSFRGIEGTGVEYVTIDLRNNSLRNFEHFGTHPKLVELRLQNNQIENLMGLTRQHSLAVLDLDGNPIAAHPWYRVMALMVVGFSITNIDGVAVSAKERDMARALGPAAALAVSYGWKLQPGERSPEEYRHVIEECKKARKQTLQQQGTLRTIAHVLKRYDATGLVTAPIPDKNFAGSGRDAWNLESLSARVKQLENLLSKANEKLETQQAHWREKLELDRVEGLTGAELCRARSILFADGIHLRTNTMALPPHELNGLIRGSLMFEGFSLVLLSFMSRVRLAEWALGDIKAKYYPPSFLRIEGTYGAIFDISFENTLTLWTVYKLIYLRCGMPVPSLHLEEEVEVNAMLRRSTTADMALDANETTGRSSSTGTKKEGGHGVREPREEIIGTVTPFFSGPRSPHDDEGPLGDSSFLGDRSVQPVSVTLASPGENALRDSSLDEGSINRPVADASTFNREGHTVEDRNTPKALRARELSQPRGQPPPPSRAPIRRCTLTFAPLIPKRYPSSNGNSGALRNSKVVDRVPECAGAGLQFHIQKFRIPASDSDSDSDSDLLLKSHSESRL
ncbi:hypothetical protein MOQ_006108 [Trypanosoma cruzi marinkellei]|uniref:Uncharacterized protein n=1 Tax=Trypanosoma cruzi marinkellei TaxID=85056 RepID=K2MST9_TRYCR|nr:hypothetical protein MOQ_006108 [Trypanosoma cruzi marinkellei]